MLYHGQEKYLEVYMKAKDIKIFFLTSSSTKSKSFLSYCFLGSVIDGL